MRHRAVSGRITPHNARVISRASARPWQRVPAVEHRHPAVASQPSGRPARQIRCAAAAQATASLVLEPIKKIEGTVTLPGSKSLSNRTLLLAALAEGTTVLENVLVRREGGVFVVGCY